MKRPGRVLVPLRMIPWDQDFTFVAGQVLFGCNDLCLTWIKGEPMPDDIVPKTLSALENKKKQALEPVDKRKEKGARLLEPTKKPSQPWKDTGANLPSEDPYTKDLKAKLIAAVNTSEQAAVVTIEQTTTVTVSLDDDVSAESQLSSIQATICGDQTGCVVRIASNRRALEDVAGNRELASTGPSSMQRKLSEGYSLTFEIVLVVHSGFGNEMLESTNRQCIAIPVRRDDTEQIRAHLIVCYSLISSGNVEKLRKVCNLEDPVHAACVGALLRAGALVLQ